MEEIRVQLDGLIFVSKREMSRVFQFKCTQGKKNIRQVDWVGKNDADMNYVFSDLRDYRLKKNIRKMKKRHICPMEKALVPKSQKNLKFWTPPEKELLSPSGATISHP